MAEVEKKEKKKYGKRGKKLSGVKKREIAIKKEVNIVDVEAALRKTGGFLSYAAEELKIPVLDLKHYLRKYKRLREVHAEVREGTTELAEHQLIQKIKDGNLLAIMFYLKCQAQDRGWVDKPLEKKKEEEKPLIIQIIPPEGYVPPKALKSGKKSKVEEYIDAEVLDG